MNMFNKFFLNIILCVGISTAVFADDPAVSFTSADINPAFNVTFSNSAGGFVLGYKFTLTESVRVTQLGYYDDFGDGLLGSHEVGLYAVDGSLLTSATINPGDTLDEVFRYTAITPIDLAAGDYVLSGVAGYDPGNPVDKYTHDPFSSTFDPRFAFIENRVLGGQGNTLTFLTDADTEMDPILTFGWYGPNLKLVEVPEPGTMLTLAGMSALVFGARSKKRRKAT